MKNLVLFTILMFCSFSSFSQNRISTKEQLPSHNFILSKSGVDKIDITPLSQTAINEIIADNDKGGLYQVAKTLPLDVTVANAGSVDNLADGGKLWRVQLASAGALSAVLSFDYFNLPEGAAMYVHCENTNTVFGPYTRQSNSNGEDYSIGIIPDDKLTIEYYIPSGMEFSEMDFKISGFDYFFRSGMSGELATITKSTDYGSSESCEVNINCSEGNDWRVQQKGVCILYIRTTSGAGWCSGSLVNNTSNDGTPYILSAEHCIDGESVLYNQCIFYFNYESPGCTSQNVTPTSFTGATQISIGSISGGTDFLLLQLTATPVQIKNANLVYNGWDRTGTASASGVSIHHPSGDIKKISHYTQALATASYGYPTASNSHWRVYWSATANGHGVTEGGSSGSPIFNGANKLIVGTLSGGSSYCDNASAYDLYGKFDKHWNNTVNGSTNAYKLAPWLDPANTGATTCLWYNPNAAASAPIANFTGTPTTLYEGGSVVFSNTSDANGTNVTYAWTFAGGTPAASTAVNPTVTYNTAGTYTVSLTITSSTGTDTKTITNYIRVNALNAAAIPFTENFENSPSWDLLNGTQTNHWVIGAAAAANQTGSTKSLYISNNTAATPAYAYTLNSASKAFAVKMLNFAETGTYTVSYDWKCNGEKYSGTDYDYAQMWLVPANVTLTAGSFPSSTSGWIGLNGTTNLYLQTTWQHKELNFNITAAGFYQLVIYWTNDNLDGNPPPAAIDNISIIKYSTVTSVSVTPSDVSVLQGNTQQFNATVTGTNNPSQTVTWAVIGGVSGTAISTNGLLTVAANETAALLTVKATSTVDNTKYDTADVTVTKIPVVANFAADVTQISEGENIIFSDLSTGNPTVWAWSFAGGTPSVSSSPNPVITYAAAGTYNVSLTVSNGYTSDTKTIEQYINVSPLSSVASPLAPKIVIYPNPATDYITIDGIKVGETVTITDLSGRTVETQCIVSLQNAAINISHLSQGVYLVRVSNMIGKLIKK